MTFLDPYFDGKFPTLYSLLIVGVLILGSIVVSILMPKEANDKK